MFERITDIMEICDIALLWSRERSETASLIESTLIDFFLKRAKKKYGGHWALDSVIDQVWDVHTQVTRDDILEFCAHTELPPPRFWFGKTFAAAGAEYRCGEWLRVQVELSPSNKPASKQVLFERAAAKFGGDLTRRGYNRVWDDVVPDVWKRPGAPEKS